MGVVTKITPQVKNPKRVSVYVDGTFFIGLQLNVLDKLGLRVGRELDEVEVARIALAKDRQNALDKALMYLGRRLHSQTELETKLGRAGFVPDVVGYTIAEVNRLGYINDAAFGVAKATVSAKRKLHGKRRAMVELAKSGVRGETARKAVEDVYEGHDAMGVARLLAGKRANGMARLDAETARRRLAGMLMRRGFTWDEIRPALDEVMGQARESESGD